MASCIYIYIYHVLCVCVCVQRGMGLYELLNKYGIKLGVRRSM